VVVSHDPEVAKLATRTVQLVDGRLAPTSDTGSATEVTHA
jgi:ABC-type lipoprotein export system ATPase subunit